MSWHLRHDWAEVGRTFNPPQRARAFSNAPPDVAERIFHGFTVVEYACRREGCTRRRIAEFLGRLPETGDDDQEVK